MNLLWISFCVLLAFPFVVASYGEDNFGEGLYGRERILQDVRTGNSGFFPLDPLPPVTELVAETPAIPSAPNEESPRAVTGLFVDNDVIADMRASILVIEEQGYPVSGAKRLLGLAQRANAQGDVGRLKELHSEVTDMRKNAVKTAQLLSLLRSENSLPDSSLLSGAVVLSTNKNLPISQQLLERAQRAANRGEFALSASLATESQKLAFMEQKSHSFGNFSPDFAFLFSLLVVIFGSVIFLMKISAKKYSPPSKLSSSRSGQVFDRSLFLFASVLVLISSILIIFGIVWGGALLENVQEDISLLTINAAERINGVNYRVETVADYLAVLVATDFENKDLFSYSAQQRYIAEITPLAKRVGEESSIINGVYVYFKKELSGNVSYVWVVDDGQSFVWEEDTEVNIPYYLDEYDPQYSTDPDYVWYYGPMQSGVPLWSDIYFDTDLGENAISYLVPVYVNGSIVAVVGVDASFAEMEKIIREIRVYDFGYAFLLDKNGEFVVPPPENAYFDDSYLWLVTGDEGLLDFNGEIWSYVRLESDHTLVVVSQKNNLLQASTLLKKRLFVALLVVIGGISCMVFFIWRAGHEYAPSDLEGNEFRRLWRSIRILLKK